MEESRKRKMGEEAPDLFSTLPPEIFEEVMRDLSIVEEGESEERQSKRARRIVHSLRETSRALKDMIDDVREREHVDIVTEGLRYLPTAEKWVRIVLDMDESRLLRELDAIKKEEGRIYPSDDTIFGLLEPLSKMCVRIRWRIGCFIVHALRASTLYVMIEEASRTDYADMFFDLIGHANFGNGSKAIYRIFEDEYWNVDGTIIDRISDISNELFDYFRLDELWNFESFTTTDEDEMNRVKVRYMMTFIERISNSLVFRDVAIIAIFLEMNREAMELLRVSFRIFGSGSGSGNLGDFVGDIMRSRGKYDMIAILMIVSVNIGDEFGEALAIELVSEISVATLLNVYYHPARWTEYHRESNVLEKLELVGKETSHRELMNFLEDRGYLIPSRTDILSLGGNYIMTLMIEAEDHERIAKMLEEISPIDSAIVNMLRRYEVLLFRLSEKNDRLKMILKDIF